MKYPAIAPIAALAFLAGCSALNDSLYGTKYPPSPPPDPTAAILAAERATTRPVSAPRVVEVPFPTAALRPVEIVETQEWFYMDDDGE